MLIGLDLEILDDEPLPVAPIEPREPEPEDVIGFPARTEEVLATARGLVPVICGDVCLTAFSLAVVAPEEVATVGEETRRLSSDFRLVERLTVAETGRLSPLTVLPFSAVASEPGGPDL